MEEVWKVGQPETSTDGVSFLLSTQTTRRCSQHMFPNTDITRLIRKKEDQVKFFQINRIKK